MKLKNILHYVGLLSLFITTLLGGLLYNGKEGVLLYFGLALIIVFIVFFLVKLMVDKKKETHASFLHKSILWSLYIAIAAGGAIISLHFITVQFIAIDDLKSNGKDKLDAITELRTEYKKSMKGVESQLYSEIKVKLKEYAHSPSKTREPLYDELINYYNFRPSIIKDYRSLRKKSNYEATAKTYIKDYYTVKIDDFFSDIDTELNQYSLINKNVFISMDFININRVYYELDSLLANNKKKIEKGFKEVLSNFNRNDKAFNNFSIPKSTVSINSFSELREQYNPLIYLTFYLLIQLLIISPLLLTEKT